jgi:hypothetical protein
MTTIYAFNTEQAALDAALKRYANYVRAMFIDGRPIKNNTGLVTAIANMSDVAVAKLKICGKIRGMVSFNLGLTESYINVRRAADGSDNWYILMLGGEHMEGVTGYTEMELPEDWKPQSFI